MGALMALMPPEVQEVTAQAELASRARQPGGSVTTTAQIREEWPGRGLSSSAVLAKLRNISSHPHFSPFYYAA